MEGKITRYRMDCERFVEELQGLGFTLEDAQALRIEGSVNDWRMSRLAWWQKLSN